MQSWQNKANAMKRIMKPIRAQAWVSAHPVNILHLSDVFLFLICFSIKLNTIMRDYTSKTPSDSSCYTTHPTSSWKLKRPPLFFFPPCIISHAQVINLHTLNGSYTPPARLLLPMRFFFLSFLFFDRMRWQLHLDPKRMIKTVKRQEGRENTDEGGWW